MRVGEAATRAGVNVETFRYYERRGLLPAPDRAPSGHRSYDDETVRFVRSIKEAQGLGFTLAEIEEFLRVKGPADEALRIRLAAKIDEVDSKIASLRRVRESLAQVVGCACTSLDHCTCGAAYLARRGRTTPAAMLHVTNGESAANTLRQTGLGGSVLAWDDALHEGPVPPVPPAELRRIRARFLADAGWGTMPAVRAELERRDELLLEAESLVLWFEHDLYDQLQLIQVLSLIEFAELIDAGTFLGPLSADELEALWPRRARVSDEQLALARGAWDAFRAPDPTGLELLVARGTPELPLLGPALRRLLEELPDARDGLSRSERQLLEALEDGPAPPPRAVPREPGARGGGVRRRHLGLAAARRARAARRPGRRRPRADARRHAATAASSRRPPSSSPTRAAPCWPAAPTASASASTAGSAART